MKLKKGNDSFRLSLPIGDVGLIPVQKNFPYFFDSPDDSHFNLKVRHTTNRPHPHTDLWSTVRQGHVPDNRVKSLPESYSKEIFDSERDTGEMYLD